MRDMPRSDFRHTAPASRRKGRREGSKDKASKRASGSDIERDTISIGLGYPEPLCRFEADKTGGRNYETYSEDPVVLGKLAAAYVTGE
jgi:hypothetical protein